MQEPPTTDGPRDSSNGDRDKRVKKNGDIYRSDVQLTQDKSIKTGSKWKFMEVNNERLCLAVIR